MTKTIQLFNYSTIQHKRGFTLIEILIATAIFGMVMLAAMGILSRLLIGQNAGSNQRVLQQSARLVMETLVRDIRVAKSVSGSSSTIMLNSGVEQKMYLYDSGQKKLFLGSPSGQPFSLFPADIQVTNFSFTFNPPPPTPNPQTILIDMTVQSTGNPPASFSLRTTVTPRLYNWVGK